MSFTSGIASGLTSIGMVPHTSIRGSAATFGRTAAGEQMRTSVMIEKSATPRSAG